MFTEVSPQPRNFDRDWNQALPPSTLKPVKANLTIFIQHEPSLFRSENYGTRAACSPLQQRVGLSLRFVCRTRSRRFEGDFVIDEGCGNREHFVILHIPTDIACIQVSAIRYIDWRRYVRWTLCFKKLSWHGLEALHLSTRRDRHSKWVKPSSPLY